MTAIGVPAPVRLEGLRPTPQDLVDLGFAFALAGIGVIGFRTVFSGHEELTVGLPAVVLGVILGHVLVRRRVPLLVGAAIGTAVFFLFGGALALRNEAIGGVLPSPNVLVGLIDGAVNGWVRLLTTLPPAGQAGNLLAIPYLCGYAGGLLTVLIAARVQRAPLWVLPPVGVLALSVLFGIEHPAALLLQGAVFGAAAIGWLAVRDARRREVVVRSDFRRRSMGGFTLLVLAAAGGAFLGPILPGATGRDRYTFRKDITPPFDPRQYPSPLAAFRLYKGDKASKEVLFTVSGLPAGERIRMSVMDDYDGLVWRATGAGGSLAGKYERVGETIPNKLKGHKATVKFTMGTLGGVWLPTVGAPNGVRFGGVHRQDLTDSFRFDRVTEAGAVPSLLSTGDEYTVQTTILDPVDVAKLEGRQLDGAVARPRVDQLPEEFQAGIQSKAATIVGEGDEPASDINKIVKEFLDVGTYSNGANEANIVVPPGHSARRLEHFLNLDVQATKAKRQFVGNGEQYAAALALLFEARGIPARVAMGFLPPVSGSGPTDVHGSDAIAWVEVPFTGVGWVPVNGTPDETNKPQPEPHVPAPAQQVETAPPPPERTKPPVTLPDSSKTEAPTVLPSPGKRAGHHGVLGVMLKIGAFVSTPLALVLGPGLVVVAMKRRRRARRRQRGTPAQRISGGWLEIIDLALDTGAPLPNRATRREISRFLGSEPARLLAIHTDDLVFGAYEPSDSDVAVVWQQVAEVRESLLQPLGRGQRVRAAVSLTSLRLTR